MKLLLDTHIILWAITDDNRMSDVTRLLILDESNDIYFSMASIWEVEIKHELGKLPLSGKEFYNKCLEAGYRLLGIEVKHIVAQSSLRRSIDAPKHNDPFDRMLIGQAKAEDLRLMTHDSLIPDYNEPCVLFV